MRGVAFCQLCSVQKVLRWHTKSPCQENAACRTFPVIHRKLPLVSLSCTLQPAKSKTLISHTSKTVSNNYFRCI